MTILLLGLLLAFVLGYTTKSLLSPERVSARIEKAASHIHKDIKVHFGSARFILSDGILPRFSVVIQNIEMSSEQACWYAPTLQIDRLRLPLSLRALFAGKSPVQKLLADHVQITLHAEMKDCLTRKAVRESFGESRAAPVVTLSPMEQSEKYSNAVRSLAIKKLSLVHQRYPEYATEFLSFNVNVRSFEPKIIEVRAKTQLLRDELVGDYLSHANLYIEYKDSPEPIVQSHFFGNWREGHYSVIANYTIGDRLLTMEGDLKHIPLSQVLRLLSKYKMVSPDLKSKQAWISGKTRMVGDIDQLYQSPFEISGLHVEGDLGDVSIDRISITSLDPLRYSPIRVDFKKLNIEKLLEFFDRPGKSRILGQLGNFTGQADIVSDKNISIAGDHSGLEFIFSNRGQRELQVIEKMRGEVQLRNDTWTFKVGRMEPRGGKVLGSVKLQADRDFSEVDIDANIEELIFADSVQRLMTNGGSVGPMSLNTNLDLQEGLVRDMRGSMTLENLTTEGMSFDRIKAQFNGLRQDLNLNLQMGRIQFAAESPGAQLFSTLVNSEPRALTVESMRGRFKTRHLQTLQWDVQGLLDGQSKVSTEGAWDAYGELNGKAQVRQGKLHQDFVIEGTRDRPVVRAEQETGS